MIRKGQRYRVLRDLDVRVLTHFRAPFTGGAKATLRAGEIFRIAHDPPEEATAASCDPENYEALHESLVPQADRLWHNYSGYSLVIDFGRIQRDCELLG